MPLGYFTEQKDLIEKLEEGADLTATLDGRLTGSKARKPKIAHKKTWVEQALERLALPWDETSPRLETGAVPHDLVPSIASFTDARTLTLLGLCQKGCLQRLFRSCKNLLFGPFEDSKLVGLAHRLLCLTSIDVFCSYYPLICKICRSSSSVFRTALRRGRGGAQSGRKSFGLPNPSRYELGNTPIHLLKALPMMVTRLFVGRFQGKHLPGHHFLGDFLQYLNKALPLIEEVVVAREVFRTSFGLGALGDLAYLTHFKHLVSFSGPVNAFSYPMETMCGLTNLQSLEFPGVSPLLCQLVNLTCLKARTSDYKSTILLKPCPDGFDRSRTAEPVCISFVWLSKLTKLRCLSLQGEKQFWTAFDFSYLTALSNLESLSIYRCGRWHGCSEMDRIIFELPRLSHLRLGDCFISDVSLRALGNLEIQFEYSDLEELTDENPLGVGSVASSAAMVETLSRFTWLRNLDLSGSEITGAELAELATTLAHRAGVLQGLVARSNNINDEGVSALACLSKMTFLNVQSNQVRPEALVGLTQLRILSARFPDWTETEFRRRVPLKAALWYY